ncbi:hypothetical protein ABPG74_010414 [Tetrahymena malaccensis]
MQAKKPLGFWQNKTELLKKYKDEKRKKLDRFKKDKKYQSSDMDTSNNSSGGRKATSDSVTLEMSELPPIWVEIHHQTENLLKEIVDIKKDIIKESAIRIRRQFNDNGEQDNKINNLVQVAMKKIKEAESNILKIDKLAANTQETQQEKLIRQNVKLSLASQIQELTVDFRRQQKGLYDQLKQYNNLGQTGFMHAIDYSQQDQMMQDQDMYEQIARERDAEINKIVDMINELSSIYQQLGHLVLETGTLIDRIDFNITQAKENTKQANVHLKKTVQYQESPTAKRCIQILIILIIIFAFILTLKYT